MDKRKTSGNNRKNKKEILIYIAAPFFNQVMGILLDLTKIVLILVIVLLAITIVVHLLPLLIPIAAVLLVVWFLFYRNRQP